MAPESKCNDPKSIQNAADIANIGFGPDGLIRYTQGPSCGDRQYPCESAVCDGGDCSDQRDSSNGVEVRKLRHYNC